MQGQSVHDRRWGNEVQSGAELDPGLPEASVGSRKVFVARNSDATVSEAAAVGLHEELNGSVGLASLTEVRVKIGSGQGDRKGTVALLSGTNSDSQPLTAEAVPSFASLGDEEPISKRGCIAVNGAVLFSQKSIVVASSFLFPLLADVEVNSSEFTSDVLGQVSKQVPILLVGVSQDRHFVERQPSRKSVRMDVCR